MLASTVAVHLGLFLYANSPFINSSPICKSGSVCVFTAQRQRAILNCLPSAEPRDQRDIGDHQTPSEHHATLSQMMPPFFAFCNCFCTLFFFFEIAERNCHRRKLLFRQSVHHRLPAHFARKLLTLSLSAARLTCFAKRFNHFCQAS